MVFYNVNMQKSSNVKLVYISLISFTPGHNIVLPLFSFYALINLWINNSNFKTLHAITFLHLFNVLLHAHFDCTKKYNNNIRKQ